MRELMSLLLPLLLLGLGHASFSRHTFITGEPVPMAWREGRTDAWQFQPLDACPRFAAPTRVVLPRPLNPAESKYMEMSFDGGQFVTPMLLVYHPDTRRVLQRVEFLFEYAGSSVTRVTHVAHYQPMGGATSDRFTLTLDFSWREHASRDVSTGMAVLLVGTFSVCAILSMVVLADEWLRARVFTTPEGASSHPSSPMEDAIIVEQVQIHGEGSWAAIVASALPNRTSKQCRERWLNYLNPAIDHGPWTPEEDALLIQQHAVLGNQWARISREFLPKRSDNMIKARWNSHLNKRDRKTGSGKKKSSAKKRRPSRGPGDEHDGDGDFNNVDDDGSDLDASSVTRSRRRSSQGGGSGSSSSSSAKLKRSRRPSPVAGSESGLRAPKVAGPQFVPLSLFLATDEQLDELDLAPTSVAAAMPPMAPPRPSLPALASSYVDDAAPGLDDASRPEGMSSMSPFGLSTSTLGGSLTPLGLNEYYPESAIRTRKRQLFLPSDATAAAPMSAHAALPPQPMLTPFRGGDLHAVGDVAPSPSLRAFYTPARAVANDGLWMTPAPMGQAQAQQVQHHVPQPPMLAQPQQAPLAGSAPAPGGLSRGQWTQPGAGFGQILPVQPLVHRTLQAINQKLKTSPSDARNAGESPPSSVVTLFNDGRTSASAAEEALSILRQNDSHAIFEDAHAYRRAHPRTPVPVAVTGGNGVDDGKPEEDRKDRVGHLDVHRATTAIMSPGAIAME